MNKELKVGLLVVIAGALLYFGFTFLKGRDFFSSTNSYYVQYSDIDGLTVSNPVIINGFTVGRVDGIEILHDKKDSLLVSITLNGDVEINNETVAELINSDFLGSKAIKLYLNKGKTVTESGGYIKANVAESISAMIQKTAMPVISNVDTLVENFKNYLKGENEKNITAAIANMSKAMANIHMSTVKFDQILAENRGNLHDVTKNLNSVTTSLDNTMKKLDPILRNVKGFSDTLTELELNQTIDEANKSLKSINELMISINQENGSIGKLLNTPDLHQNLNATIKDIDYLVTDMQANPKRYIQFSVIGGTPKDEKAIIKSFNEKNITTQIVLELKREAPSITTVKLFKADRTSIDVIPKGLGTKQLVIDLPAGFGTGYYLAKIDWQVGSEAFQFEVK